MLGFTRPSVQTELDRFYKSISNSPDNFESISKSAFTQSRKKLQAEAFIKLNNSQLDYFYKNAPFQKSWKGSRVVAIDGSILNLPHNDELNSSFGSVTNQHDQIIGARCSFAYDVCNELVLDAKIDRRKSCEKELAVSHLNSLSHQNDILVFDRGYPCHWLIGVLQKQDFKFCFRVSTAWKSVFKLIEEQGDDIDWTFNYRSDKGKDKIEKYKLPKQLKGLRVVCVELSSGEKEVLVTNLIDREKYSLQDLKELYHLRWGVEESYKTFKKVAHIEYFTGKSTLAIKQDFHSKVFMLNMASMIGTQGIVSSSKGKRMHDFKLNKTQVFAKTKDFLIDVFYGKRIKKIVTQILSIIRKRTEIIRPNRSFDRPDTSSRRRMKIMNSKGV